MTEDEWQDALDARDEDISRLIEESAAFEKRALAAEDAIDDIQRITKGF
jgi:hypothetical protein